MVTYTFPTVAVHWTHWSTWYVLPRSTAAGAVDVVMSSLRETDVTRVSVRALSRSFVDSIDNESPTMMWQERHWKTRGIDGSAGGDAGCGIGLVALLVPRAAASQLPGHKCQRLYRNGPRAHTTVAAGRKVARPS